ncbi:hypothetical protein [Leucobacter sp. M11]|nr:hypothetical protein [Leucobacter sp. M11]MEB4614015.1 hypothetical protein [Leucobacter sp. M11]
MKLEAAIRVGETVTYATFEGADYATAYASIVPPEGGQVLSVRTTE